MRCNCSMQIYINIYIYIYIYSVGLHWSTAVGRVPDLVGGGINLNCYFTSIVIIVNP